MKTSRPASTAARRLRLGAVCVLLLPAALAAAAHAAEHVLEADHGQGCDLCLHQAGNPPLPAALLPDSPPPPATPADLPAPVAEARSPRTSHCSRAPPVG